jgi:hypothetical protein
MDGLTLSNIILFDVISIIAIVQGQLYESNKIEENFAPWFAYKAIPIACFLYFIGALVYLTLFAIYYSLFGAIIFGLFSYFLAFFLAFIFVKLLGRLMISIFGLVIAPICYFYLITGLPL